MSIPQAVSLGIAGNILSKQITGTSEVSAGRTVVATGAGTALGAVAAGTLVVAGLASAPITVPLAVATGAVSFIASLFD
jgi:hypothetical protein